VTDPTSVVVGLFSNVAFGVPLLVLGVVALFWILARYGHAPPHFRPIGPDRSWTKGPFAYVEEGIAAGQIVPAVTYASYRVRMVLWKRFGVAAVPAGPFWSVGSRLPPPALELIRTCRRLDSVYRLAWMAESTSRNDLISRWRRASWRTQSRLRFSEMLTELERLLPPLEVGT